jgi:hypothetical protein
MYTVQAGMHGCLIPILYPAHTQGSDHPDKRSTSRFQLPAGTVQIGLFKFYITYKLKHLEHTPKTANKHLKPVLYRRSEYSGFRPRLNPMSKHASMAQYRSRIARGEPHTCGVLSIVTVSRELCCLLHHRAQHGVDIALFRWYGLYTGCLRLINTGTMWFLSSGLFVGCIVGYC